MIGIGLGFKQGSRGKLLQPAWITSGNLFASGTNMSAAGISVTNIAARTAGAISCPIEGLSGTEIIADAVNGAHELFDSIPNTDMVVGKTYMLRTIVKRNTLDLQHLWAAGQFTTGYTANFNLLTGVSGTSASAPTSQWMTQLPDNWWLLGSTAICTISATANFRLFRQLIWPTTASFAGTDIDGAGTTGKLYIAAVGLHRID